MISERWLQRTSHYSHLTSHREFSRCEKFFYPSASIRISKSFLLVTPVTWSRSWPFLKKSKAGIARILYLIERLWFSSTLTFATLITSAFSCATSSSSGAIILQGPHHSAQKSTITGLSCCVTSRSKLDSLRLIIWELSMALRKISPNLNNQNEGRNCEEY